MNREYFKNYFKTYYAKRKNEYIELLGGKCVKCGTVENLEFDHKEPSSKEFNITEFLSFSHEAVLKELTKCQLLCTTCHKYKTNKPRRHGTATMYRIGCRCELCSGANTENMRKWKLRKVGQRSVTPS